MKCYEKPKIEVNKLHLEDVVLSSIQTNDEIFDIDDGPFDEEL